MLARFVNDFCDNYIEKLCPSYSLVYLYILRFLADGRESPDKQSIAGALHLPESDVEAAICSLSAMGLLSRKNGYLELPQTLKLQNIGEKLAHDAVLAWLYDETSAALGGALGRSDIDKLYSIYDDLKLSPEVIMLLVNYAAGQKKKMRFIEKTALEWHRDGITTVAKANAYIERTTPTKNGSGKRKSKFDNFVSRNNYNEIEDLYFEQLREAVKSE